MKLKRKIAGTEKVKFMGSFHTEAMLSPKGLKTFVLPQQNLFPNILEFHGRKYFVFLVNMARA